MRVTRAESVRCIAPGPGPDGGARTDRPASTAGEESE